MKKLLTVTGFTAMLTLLRMAAGFLVAKVVAVYAGPTGMAMLGQIQNLVSALNGIVTAPAGNAVVRFTAQNHQQGFDACAPWWRASLKWVGILLLLVMPIAILGSDFLSKLLFDSTDYSWIIVIVGLMLPLSALGSLINSVTNGMQNYKRFVALGFVSVFLSSSVMVGLIVEFHLKGALIAAALQTGLIGCILLALSLQQPWIRIKYWWGDTGAEQKKAISGYFFMALASAICIPTSLVIVRNVLVANVGWEQAGQWQAVWKISEVYLSVITMALGTYFLPKLSCLQSKQEIRAEINQTALVVVPIISLLAMVIYFSRDGIIFLLFTESFSEARNLFFVQLLGDVVKIAGWIYAYPMLSRGMTKWFVVTEVSFSLSFVVFSCIFIFSFGVLGVVLAYLLNYITYFVFIFFVVKPFSD